MDRDDLLRQIEKHNENKKREEDNRYETIVKQLNQLSKPKRLDIFVAIIVFLTFLAAIAGLYLQVYLPVQKSLDNASRSDKFHTLSNTEKQKSLTQSPESHNAKNPQKSSSLPPEKK